MIKDSDIFGIGEFGVAVDESETAVFTHPVVRPHILEAHRGRFPLIGRTHVQRGVFAIIFNRFQHGEEIVDSLRLGQAIFIEDGFVVDEAVNDRGHRHAENVGAVIGDPGAFGDGAEILHPFQVVERGQITGVEQGQGSVKGAAGDQVAGRAAFQFGV